MDDPGVAKILSNLGYLYASQRRYAEAEPLYRRSLGIYEARLGPEHPDVARTLVSLADLRVEQAQYADAVRAWLRERIADYKVPKRVKFERGLPREDSGKFFKRRLRAPYWEQAGRQI
jgi:long-chain acyl-CoA synthetase